MSVAGRPELFSPFSRHDLSLLAAVGRYGDIGEVARRAGIRHGTVERRLDRLDRAVGLPLTLRSRHTARLTSPGSRMLAAGRRFFHQIDLATRTHIHGHGSEAVDAPEVLSLASTEPLLEEVVEDVAALLGLLLSVRYEAPRQVAAQLAGHHVDAAYTWSLDAPRHSLERTTCTYEVLDDPLWVILPRDHPLADRDEVSLVDLREETWVSETGPTSEILVARVFQAAGLPEPHRLHVTSASVARGILRRGEAIGLGSPTHPAVLAPSLVRRSLTERPRRTTSLLVDPTIVPRALAGRLARLLADSHLRRFAKHHRELLHEPWWAHWYAEQTRRRPHPDGTTPRADAAPGPAEERKLDVQDLHLLRAVARHGSINRAAAVLSISQSALTRRIHRLEKALGARLLLRSPRGTSLTGPTRQFLRQLDLYEAEFRDTAVTCRMVDGPLEQRSRPAGHPVSVGARQAGEAG
ncbi:LysR family transcriptional regulator [Streptomyces sp. SID2888]|uniref:LysR family transcriptional regulator n=1 Tax=Streptomyces sp. SID2888 TaxID=2690256 RepID=UPI00136FA022|nr:LysR family transcriptional regulator [Streptomyces sp. SID2888]MYV47379.1 LysR family transcriptional regulator [Streptomyces sp. SID2888]